MGKACRFTCNYSNAGATIAAARDLLNLAVIEPSRGGPLVLYIYL